MKSFLLAINELVNPRGLGELCDLWIRSNSMSFLMNSPKQNYEKNKMEYCTY